MGYKLVEVNILGIQRRNLHHLFVDSFSFFVYPPRNGAVSKSRKGMYKLQLHFTLLTDEALEVGSFKIGIVFSYNNVHVVGVYSTHFQ